MPRTLVFNPGSASLKVEIIETVAGQSIASAGRKIVSASIEDIGKDPRLLVFEDRQITHQEPCKAASVAAGGRAAVQWLRDRDGDGPSVIETVDRIGVRVVHGGAQFTEAVPCTVRVREEIAALQELAPLHNQSSLDVLDVVERELTGVPTMVAFDTAFHRTLPEKAWRYPIDRETADRLGIRKFGFHGLSHRYMLEQYAHSVGKPASAVSIVTLHLESGCSACAIGHGRSIETSMGLTPLEGLMMGTRSGSIDPSIVPFLMHKLNTKADDVMKLLNKHSGLLGIAGGTFDTRELLRRSDDAAKLALDMFSWRIRLTVGAYLAALGDAEAIIFGGGIGEDTPAVRAEVCRGLRGWGLELDEAANAQSTSGEPRISTGGSRLQALVIPVEEGLEIAHECQLALMRNKEPSQVA